MKVLHLGINIASQMAVSVESLRGLGVQCRGLVSSSSGSLFSSQGVLETLPPWHDKHDLAWINGHLTRYRTVLSAIAWADVLHWHYGAPVLPREVDMLWVRALRKPGVVEFWGSDIRIGDIEKADNPYAARYIPESYFSAQSYPNSMRLQKSFAALGFDCLTSCRSMLPYIQPGLFRRVHLVRQRLPLGNYTARFPDANVTRPVVVHSPSSLALKGTDLLLAAVDKLRNDNIEFEFRLIHNRSHQEALDEIAAADVFVDQLLLGAHGVAAIEAMALGKPVVCYIKPSMLAEYPPDLPITVATPDNIAEILKELIRNGRRRRELGIQGRAYVERTHEATARAAELSSIYQGLREKAPQPGVAYGVAAN